MTSEASLVLRPVTVSPAAKREHRRLGPREEAEGDEARPQPAGDVQGRLRELEEPFPVRRPEVLEPDLPPRGRHADLSAVEVASEHEVEVARLEPGHVVGEVREEDAEIGPRVGQPAEGVVAAPRVGPRHLHAAARHREELRAVLEQARLWGRTAELGWAAEGIPRLGDVVVAEDDERPQARTEPPEGTAEGLLSAAAADEVAGDCGEVELEALRPRERLLERAGVERPRPQVEVGEVE